MADIQSAMAEIRRGKKERRKKKKKPQDKNIMVCPIPQGNHNNNTNNNNIMQRLTCYVDRKTTNRSCRGHVTVYE